MALDFNDPDLEFSDLVYAYQSWVMAVINDEKLGGEETLLTDEIADDALNAMRFLPGEVTSAIETSLARVYDVDADELAACCSRKADAPRSAHAPSLLQRPTATRLPWWLVCGVGLQVMQSPAITAFATSELAAGCSAPRAPADRSESHPKPHGHSPSSNRG